MKTRWRTVAAPSSDDVRIICIHTDGTQLASIDLRLLNLSLRCRENGGYYYMGEV
jgi:hypothetical protein